MRQVQLWCVTVAFLISLAATAVAANCEWPHAARPADFTALGFTDVTTALRADDAVWQRYRDNLQNLQRVYKHDPSQSLIMLGYSALPDELAGERGVGLLQQRLQRLRQSARSSGYDFEFNTLPDMPVSAEFTATATRRGGWPYREMGLEIITDQGCWAVFKLGTGRDGVAMIPVIREQFMTLRQDLNQAPSRLLPPLAADLDLQRLPPFSGDNLLGLILVTGIIALVVGIMIGRAGRAVDGLAVRWFFRALATGWLVYLVVLSIAPRWVLPADFFPALEHFVYAGIMLAVALLGMMFGAIMALPAVALGIAHSVRSSLFLVLDFSDTPVIVWFDVGVLMLLALAVLVFGFRRHPQGLTLRQSRSVIERRP